MANETKSEQLGMPFGTASHRLRKQLMFQLVCQAGRDQCFRCGEKIASVDEFSVDHKEPWQDSGSPVEFFFGLDNVAFSHLSCNIKAFRRKPISHPSRVAYDAGCRCDKCKAINTARQRKYREEIRFNVP